MKVKVEIMLDLDLEKLIRNRHFPIRERLQKSITKMESAKVSITHGDKENLLEGVDIKELLSSQKLHIL